MESPATLCTTSQFVSNLKLDSGYKLSYNHVQSESIFWVWLLSRIVSPFRFFFWVSLQPFLCVWFSFIPYFTLVVAICYSLTCTV